MIIFKSLSTNFESSSFLRQYHCNCIEIDWKFIIWIIRSKKLFWVLVSDYVLWPFFTSEYFPIAYFLFTWLVLKIWKIVWNYMSSLWVHLCHHPPTHLSSGLRKYTNFRSGKVATKLRRSVIFFQKKEPKKYQKLVQT